MALTGKVSYPWVGDPKFVKLKIFFFFFCPIGFVKKILVTFLIRSLLTRNKLLESFASTISKNIHLIFLVFNYKFFSITNRGITFCSLIFEAPHWGSEILFSSTELSLGNGYGTMCMRETLEGGSGLYGVGLLA